MSERLPRYVGRHASADAAEPPSDVTSSTADGPAADSTPYEEPTDDDEPDWPPRSEETKIIERFEDDAQSPDSAADSSTSGPVDDSVPAASEWWPRANPAGRIKPEPWTGPSVGRAPSIEPEPEPESEPTPEFDRESEFELETEFESEPTSRIDWELETETETAPEPETDTVPRFRLSMAPDPPAEPEPEPEPETEARLEPAPEPPAPLETEAESQVYSLPEPALPEEPEPEPVPGRSGVRAVSDVDSHGLARLTLLDAVQEIWPGGTPDLTTWLAEHLDLLEDTLGFSLSPQHHFPWASDQRVVAGLGTDPAPLDIPGNLMTADLSGASVMVRAQVDVADTEGLGALLSAAAAAQAQTAVWVCPRIDENLRQTLRWVGGDPSANVRLYGLEMYLVKIGESPTAPLFDAVVSPGAP